MKERKCPLCYEKIYSKVGKECKMCGMVLEDAGRDFCSRICRIKHSKTNKVGKSSLILIIFVNLIGLVSADVGDVSGGCWSGMILGNYGMGILGWILMLLVLVILVLIIVWLVKQIQRK